MATSKYLILKRNCLKSELLHKLPAIYGFVDPAM